MNAPGDTKGLAIAWVADLQERVGQMFDEEATLSGDEAREIARLLSALTTRIESAEARADARVSEARIAAAREMKERAWSAGWDDCKASLTADEAYCLTHDVKADAWAEAAIRALPDVPEEGGEDA